MQDEDPPLATLQQILMALPWASQGVVLALYSQAHSRDRFLEAVNSVAPEDETRDIAVVYLIVPEHSRNRASAEG